MDKRVRVPKKGAGRRLAQKLKELGQQKPPQTLIDKINGDDKKKVAVSTPSASKDVEI